MAAPISKDFVYPNQEAVVDLSSPHITWVNHSTFWVTCNNISILMDPIWVVDAPRFSFSAL